MLITLSVIFLLIIKKLSIAQTNIGVEALDKEAKLDTIKHITNIF